MPARSMLVVVALAAALVAVAAAPASAFKLYGPAWPAQTVTYHVDYGPYQGFADKGAAAWNASGMRIRLRNTSSADKANIRIGVTRGSAFPSLQNGVAGVTNLAARGPDIAVAKITIIKLTSAGQREFSRELTLIVTHEMGHALGLDHETRQCALMNTTIANGAPKKCGAPPAGRRYCRVLETDDEKGVVKLYGGSPAKLRNPRYC